MRHPIIGILCSAAFLTTGCNSNSPTNPKPPAGAMTVDPEKIVSAAGSIRTLHGEFSIRDAKPNERYVAPASVGGACLLAKIPVEGKSCTAQEQCDITIPGPPTEEWSGYCLGDDQRPAKHGTCWVKLSDAKNCLKQVGLGNYSTQEMDMSPAYRYVAEHSPGWHKPIDWVLLGCLNGVPPGGCPTGNGPYIDRSSHVRPVP